VSWAPDPTADPGPEQSATARHWPAPDGPASHGPAPHGPAPHGPPPASPGTHKDQNVPAGPASVAGRLADCAASPPLQVLRGLESTWRGLDEAEAALRLARLGDNTISADRPPRWHRRVLAAGRDPFALILICLTVVSAATGSLPGAAVIAAMVMTSCVLRARQEHHSDRAVAALRAMVATTATVVRRAARGAPAVAREVPVDQLVPGDIVTLAAGDMVPADLRLLAAGDLAVSQAVFTGESLPAAKRAAPVITGGSRTSAGARPPHTSQDPSSVFDSPVLCFMGTSVVSGSGTGVVVATGPSTYLGCTHAEPRGQASQTAFERRVREVAWLLASLMLCCAPLVFAVNASVRHGLVEPCLFAVAVAVGLTPEMLPVVVTSALARGAARLAGRAAIVKRLPAMHNLGAMDVLCTDKTGTLTEGLTSVDCHIDPAGRSEEAPLRWAWLNSYWLAEAADGAITDVLDEALLACGAERGLAPDSGMRLVDVIPFDHSRRRVTVITAGRDQGQRTLITKGAPLDVLDCCSRARCGGRDRPLGRAGRARARSLAGSLARDGVRLLAVAVATRRARAAGYRPDDEADLTLVGFAGFRDRPSQSASRAVAELTALGVAVKVITGDHPLLAARVCHDVGIKTRQVVTGAEIALLDDQALAAVADAGTVFARVDPAQKARLVRALRSAGHTVGFLGDGINDVAALRAADVGICAAGAVPAARECADVILLRQDLTMLGQAVAEGRRSLANVVKYLKITISSNVGNALSMLAASAVLPFLPMLPLQVLAQNLCFDLSQLSLAFDTTDDPSGQPALDRRALARFVLWFAPVNTLADLATFALLWRFTGGHDSAAAQTMFRTAWFAENLLTQALAVHLLRSRHLPSRRHHAARPVLLSTVALTLLALALPATPLGSALHLTPLPAPLYPLLALVLTTYCLAVLIVRRRRPDPPGSGVGPPIPQA
jgi:P-type Mg2+ transporter